MKFRRISPVITLSLLGLVAMPVLAATTETAVVKQKKHHSHHAKAVKPVQQPIDSSDNTNAIETVGNMPTTGIKYLPVDLDVPGQSFVSSGPYIGIPLEYSGSNLIINSPSVNQDVALLKVNKNIHNRLRTMGITEDEEHSHVLLSGVVEGQANYQQPAGGPNSTNIDLTSAGIDAYILGSTWTSALISLNYDNDIGADEGSLSTNSRTLNSRVYVNQAFITIGNFNLSPVYGTLGQFYVPFGTYGSNMVSSPFTKILGRIKARAIVVGYQQQADDALYGSTFIFKGDTYAGATSRVNNGGINVGYRFKQGRVHADIGASVVANIADSVGMQNVGFTSPYFNGFGGVLVSGVSTGNEQIVHRVPAYDVRALLGLGDHIDLLAEYVTASTRFNPNDLTMNGHGAKPSALDVEAAYSFEAFSRPNSIALGYGMSKDGLAIGLAAQRYSVVFNTSAWRNTLQSLEFRHDVNYAASSSATGSNVSPATVGPGRPDNVVTAQFDLYF